MLYGWVRSWFPPKPDLVALRGAYMPWRFKVLGHAAFSGIVASIKLEPDGDIHILVDVSPGQVTHELLAPGQTQLVVELMDGQSMPATLVIGNIIAGMGTWVYDSWHGWNEIHPVFELYGLDVTPDPRPRFTIWEWLEAIVRAHRGK